MEHVHEYIECLDEEISEMVKMEAKADDLMWENEKRLHVLFENRKHAKAWAEEAHLKGMYSSARHTS